MVDLEEVLGLRNKDVAVLRLLSRLPKRSKYTPGQISAAVTTPMNSAGSFMHDMGINRTIAQFSAIVGTYGTVSDPVENLEQRGLVATKDGHVTLTPLGLDIVDVLEQGTDTNTEEVNLWLPGKDATEELLSVHRVLSKQGEFLFVDAYVSGQEIFDLAGKTECGRVLCGDRNDPRAVNRINSIRVVLGEINSVRTSPFEVRDSSQVHDRYIIPPSGTVLMLGMSANGIGKNGKGTVVVSLPPGLSNDVRDKHEALWSAATGL